MSRLGVIAPHWHRTKPRSVIPHPRLLFALDRLAAAWFSKPLHSVELLVADDCRMAICFGQLPPANAAKVDWIAENLQYLLLRNHFPPVATPERDCRWRLDSLLARLGRFNLCVAQFVNTAANWRCEIDRGQWHASPTIWHETSRVLELTPLELPR
jgi:hypothetical protein